MGLVAIESLFAAVDETDEQAVLISVPGMRIVYANKLYLAGIGKTLEEATAMMCHQASHHLDHPCDGDGHRCPVRITMESGEAAEAVHLHAAPGGAEVLVNVSSRPVWDASGKVTHVLEIIRRNDEQRMLHDDLKRKTGFLEKILQTCPEGIIGNDIRGNIFMFNEGAERIFGYSRSEAIGKVRAKELYPEGGAREVRDLIRSEKYGGAGRLVDFETCILNNKGERVPIRLCCTAMRGEDGRDTGYIGFFTDITERKMMEEMQRTLSITDGLTKLYNRRHFQSLAQKEKDRIHRSRDCSSLALIDVDHFKAYNDAWGHAEGDAVLQALASLISGTIRASDTGFRFGGEEFAVLLPDTSAENARGPAERLRRSFCEIPFHPSGATDSVRVTISIGIAEFIPGRSVDDVVRLSDAALYAAKNGGRNRVVVYDAGPSPGP